MVSHPKLRPFIALPPDYQNPAPDRVSRITRLTQMPSYAIAAVAEPLTELPLISRARLLSVRPLPITFFRPNSGHKQYKPEETLRGVVLHEERVLDRVAFSDA